MSAFEEISHLDFVLGERIDCLRERAQGAFLLATEAQKLELIQIAHDKIIDVLEEMNADDCRVTIKNVKDGNGEVIFKIDGMDFRVMVTYKAGREPDDPPSTVALSVRLRGGNTYGPVSCLAELGRLLDEGKVACDTD